jgi:hypothetical protein
MAPLPPVAAPASQDSFGLLWFWRSQSILKDEPEAVARRRFGKYVPSLVVTPPGTRFAATSHESGLTDTKAHSADPATLEDMTCATAHLEARLPHTLRSAEPLMRDYTISIGHRRAGWLTFGGAAPEALSIQACRACICPKAHGGRRPLQEFERDELTTNSDALRNLEAPFGGALPKPGRVDQDKKERIKFPKAAILILHLCEQCSVTGQAVAGHMHGSATERQLDLARRSKIPFRSAPARSRSARFQLFLAYRHSQNAFELPAR